MQEVAQYGNRRWLSYGKIRALPDNILTLVDSGDQYKKGAFQLSGITTGNTRTLTWPDASGTIALMGGSIDHGVDLTGLGDDDHTQYALLTGRDANQLIIDSIRAYDAAGLGLYEDGGLGIFVEDSTGYVGILDVTPSAPLDVNGSIRGGYDTDTTSYLGRAAIGYADTTNHAVFAHIDFNTTASAALRQVASGTTLLNAPTGQPVYIQINNSTVASFTSALPIAAHGDSIRIITSQSPASGGTGIQGEIAWDAGYLYVCTATNTWERVALTGGY